MWKNLLLLENEIKVIYFFFFSTGSKQTSICHLLSTLIDLKIWLLICLNHEDTYRESNFLMQIGGLLSDSQKSWIFCAWLNLLWAQ